MMIDYLWVLTVDQTNIENSNDQFYSPSDESKK